MAHYAAATQSDYLSGPARKVLLETARYWLARMDRRQGDDYPSLLGVMGPDEYTPITSNNAYTNRMVKLALAHAAHAAAAEGLAAEAGAFAEASAQLPIPTRADGLVLECEEFERLAEPRFDELWRDRTVGFANHVSQERLYRSKCLKQADVLMMMMLFPHEFTDAQVRQAYDYYLPYTTHDSSLSMSVHAIVACRLGLNEQAWDFWRACGELDLDVRHGGAANGIHIAAAGANWQVAVMGFAGMATAVASETFTLRPRLPQAWTRLAFPIIWKGQPLTINITSKSTTVTNRGTMVVTVRIGAEEKQVEPGRCAGFEDFV